MKYKRLFFVVVLWIILVSLFCGYLPVHAQGMTNWSPAKPIPFYDDEFPPILVADQNGTVHAFDSLIEDDVPVIYYRRWTIDQGWSQSVDIILPKSNSNQPLQDVSLDKNGIFHLIYFGGTPDSGVINYARADVSEVNRAQAWSKPIEIGEGAGPLDSAAMKGDGKGNLIVLYSGRLDGVGLYEVHSVDGGNTWSLAKPIFMVSDKERWPHHIKMEYDNEGQFHAVWSVINQEGKGDEVYYARRDPDGIWSDPFLLAAREGNDYAADWPSIIDYKGELFVMYMDGTIPNGVPSRWMRRSIDGGRTWTTPIRPFQLVGEHGFAVLLIDSNEQLHIIFANRVANPLIEGVWHGTWLGNRWSELELITPRSPAEAVAIGSYKYVNAASRPNGIMSRGNTILLTWWHDGVLGIPAGYTYKIIDSPALTAVQFPARTPEPTFMTPTQTIPVPNVTLMPTLSIIDQNQGSPHLVTPADVSTQILAGILPTILLITLIYVITQLYHRKIA